jgi:hypothetical protein
MEQELNGLRRVSCIVVDSLSNVEGFFVNNSEPRNNRVRCVVLQKELDDLWETRTREREREREARPVRGDAEELRMLRDRRERLEEEQGSNQGGWVTFSPLSAVVN